MPTPGSDRHRPYKITKVDGTTEIDMERYDGYYAGSPKGRPAIRYIKIHEVPDATTELTELLGGKADWIWGYNADQFANIARMPNLEAVRFGTMRVHFMTVDGAGRSGADNPLTKLKVRQAVIFGHRPRHDGQAAADPGRFAGHRHAVFPQPVRL